MSTSKADGNGGKKIASLRDAARMRVQAYTRKRAKHTICMTKNGRVAELLRGVVENVLDYRSKVCEFDPRLPHLYFVFLQLLFFYEF